jgi:hypothetical protein
VRAAQLLFTTLLAAHAAGPPLRLAREDNWLVIQAPDVPGQTIRINYLEAYCRANSTDADWVKHTVIRHRSEIVALSEDGRSVHVRDTLEDGITVEHAIRAYPGEVEFRLNAFNPGARRSEAHWAQPCVRLGAFTGFDPDHRRGDINDYLRKCFVFLDGRLARMPTPQWSTKARYTPGQVWRPAHVPLTDVNPRPLNPRTPDNGLIGCFSGDENWIFATAWEPYQELFQGIARCIHSDFRLGGLQPGERKLIRGKIYIAPNDVSALLERYRADFPEHFAAK